VVNLVWVSISFSAGMIAGSIVSASKKSWNHFTISLFLGFIGVYIGLFFIGIAPPGFVWSMWMIVLGGFCTTFGIPIFLTIVRTMTQLIIPIEKMGRFSGFTSAIISIITPIGYLLTGFLAEITEIRYVIIGASIIAIISMICIWSFSQIGELEPLAKEKLTPVHLQPVKHSQSEITTE
jgi:MFS family permease